MKGLGVPNDGIRGRPGDGGERRKRGNAEIADARFDEVEFVEVARADLHSTDYLGCASAQRHRTRGRSPTAGLVERPGRAGASLELAGRRAGGARSRGSARPVSDARDPSPRRTPSRTMAPTSKRIASTNRSCVVRAPWSRAILAATSGASSTMQRSLPGDGEGGARLRVGSRKGAPELVVCVEGHAGRPALRRSRLRAACSRAQRESLEGGERLRAAGNGQRRDPVAPLVRLARLEHAGSLRSASGPSAPASRRVRSRVRRTAGVGPDASSST